MEIRIDGLNVNYLATGEGQPFLILHGWGSNSLKWQKVADILSRKGFKVIVPDLPGFGKDNELNSAWGLDDYVVFVEKFVSEIGIEKFILAGHSFGGGIGVKYAIRNPGKVEKLFLLAAACIRRDDFKKRSFRIFSKIFKVFSFIPGLRKAFYRFIVRRSDYQYAGGALKGTYLKIVKEDLSDLLGKVKNETVLIWGDKDEAVPLSEGKEINEKMPGSKLVVIKGADHNFHQKMPDILAAKILENV